MFDCLILNSHLYLTTASKYIAWICSLSLSYMGLLANKSALVSVLKTKLEPAVQLISELTQEYVELDTFFIHADDGEWTKLNDE